METDYPQGSESLRKKTRLAVSVGLVSNIVLAIVKTSVGIVGNSPALLADGINSTSDLVYYLVVSVFVRAAQKPADENHPYGHTQLESVGALVVGAFVITTAITIFWNSINTLVQVLRGQNDFSGSQLPVLYVAIGTVLIKIALFYFTRQLAKQSSNDTVSALAADHRNDIMAALAAGLGIYFGRFGYPWVEPLAGALVAFFILRTGISIIKDSSDTLMDTVPGEKLNQQIRAIASRVEGVTRVESVRAHRFGQYYVVNITICVDGRISVHDGDLIASRVEEELKAQIENLLGVYVHYHPGQKFRAEL